MRIEWKKRECGVGFIADIGNITLCVTPDRTTRFGTRAARGTKWHAQCSIWDGKSTLSRYGRDTYGELCDSAKDAMRLAEAVYNEERSVRQAA
jgi:hypothetical protein